MNNNIISIFKKYPPLLVSISLFGANDDTYEKVTGIKGAFSVVLDNCHKLKSAEIRIALKSPIMTYTLTEMHQMKEVAATI